GDVDVHRTLAPMFQDHAGASCQVDASRFASFDGDGAHELAHYRLGYGLTHSDARSKLTNFRISALYRECAESESSSASFAYRRSSGRYGVSSGTSKPRRRRRGAPTRTSSDSMDSVPD